MKNNSKYYSTKYIYNNFFNEPQIKRRRFWNILTKFNTYLTDEIIKGRTVYLPETCGTVFVVMRPVNIYAKGLNNLRSKIHDVPERYYFLNNETNGYYVKFTWKKRGLSKYSRNQYRFVPCRIAKRRLHHFVKETGQKYPVVK